MGREVSVAIISQKITQTQLQQYTTIKGLSKYHPANLYAYSVQY